MARECLVDGDVAGNTLEEVVLSRVKSMYEMYGTSKEEYLQKVVPEFRKLANIDEGEVNLWFEDDLFCQVNFWFVCSLLVAKSISVYLIRPTGSLQYGFAGYKPEELPELFRNRVLLSEPQIKQFSQLWKAYQNNDPERLTELSKSLAQDFPFVAEAVQAQLSRFPYGNGLPEHSLTEIMTELNSHDFGTVFKEFSKRHPIYGFGDLQVKRLFDQLTK